MHKGPSSSISSHPPQLSRLLGAGRSWPPPPACRGAARHSLAWAAPKQGLAFADPKMGHGCLPAGFDMLFNWTGTVFFFHGLDSWPALDWIASRYEIPKWGSPPLLQRDFLHSQEVSYNPFSATMAKGWRLMPRASQLAAHKLLVVEVFWQVLA